MKQFYLLIFSFSLLTASEKSTSFTRFSDLTSDQKKRVNERLKRFEDRKELKKFERFSHSDKISKKEYNQLRRSLLQQDRKHVKKKRSPNGRLDREAVKSNNSSKIKTMDTNLYGRWESEGDEEGVFITLNSAVTIPDLEQFIGLEEGIGEMGLISTLDGNVIHDPNLKYMYASDYTFGGAIHLTNYSWFEEIPEGSQVFNLLFFYDTGFGDFEDFIEYLKKVDLRYPTAGFLEIYTWVDWESDEDDNWFYIPFGHGQAPEGSVKFGGGLVALIFDGAGTVAISDPFDPTVPEEDSYSVSDEGILMTSEGPSGMVNSDGSVVAFLMQEEGTEQGLVALGFKTPETKPNLASLQDTYYGTRITRDSQSFLGTTYEYPNVDIFAVSFDGLGGYAVEPLSGDDAESFSGTYTISENGMILFDSGPIGFISADSSYGVWATPETEEDEDNEAVGFIVKAGVEKSAASLEGVFSFTQFEGGLELGTEVSIHFGIYSGEVEFDGAGTYTVSDGEESETGTYDVSATGVLTVDDEEFGFVGPGDDVILFANLEQYSGGAGVAVKKSTGMTDASLAGYYGVAFLEVYSDAPEMASIEDHVTVDFFGVTDTSEVNVTVVDEYYDDDGELWIDLRFPAPSGITISNLVFEGYDFNEDWLTFEVGGELSIENMTIAAGVPYPLPSLWDWDGEDDDGDFFLEFESNNFGRGIDTWSYTNDDDGTTEEWSDTTNFLWSANNDTLHLLISSWEWDEETDEEFETYEKVELEYFFSGPMLSLSDQSEVCDWWEDGWDSWADCIKYEYPILDLAMSFAGNAFEDAYQTWEEDFTYRGEVPTKPTRASSLPMVGSMPNIFMQDMEISGNRLYSGGDVNFDGTMERYLRILDIADPKNPKELAFQKPTDANTSYLFDMVMKGNVLITNDDYGPNFYNVEGDKITAGVGSYHLDFDGSDDYVDIGAISTNFTTADFSIQAWVKTDRSIAQGILLKSDGDGTWDESDFHLYMTSGGYVNWVGWGRDYISGNKTVNDGKWHHVVVVWDYSGSGTTGTGKMYVDGTDATGSSSYNANGNDLNSNKLYFGKDNNSETDNYFDGSLKEISIWSQALTANEVSTLYNAGSGKTATTVQTSKVVGYWELDEGSGSTVTDESGNSNNGAISGAAWARNAGGGIAATKCCFGDVMALHGNNLYIPTKGDMGNGFRIIDVTVPTLPSITKDVELGDLDDDDEWAPWFSDIHANDSYVYIIDWGGGEGTDDCEDANVLRIHSAASPYSQVAKFNIGNADKMEIAGSFLYTTSCGEFRIYDISDVSNITKVATLDPWELSSGHNEYFQSFDGEIEKVGNYVYIATGGYDDWWDKGIDIIDVTHHTAPVHVGRIPGTKRNEEAGGGLDYHVRSVEVSGGYVYVPQQSRGSEVDDTVGKGSAKGSLSIYQNDFAPQPFSLMFPPNGITIEITSENAWEDSIVFAWGEAVDIEGSSIMYQHEVTGDLAEFFLISSNMTSNKWSIPYHHVKYYMDQAGISVAKGTWNIWASDGPSNVRSGNGPYELTIDATGLSVENGDFLPDQFQLHANFPNPFNPTTSIKYDLPEDATVSLMIYDITGREIRHLVNETQNAGFKAIMWDGTNNYGHQVGTGMYLYQIKAGSFTQTKKMMFLK